MLKKEEIVKHALEIGFDDIGFTTAEVFESQRDLLSQRQEYYAWAAEKGLDLINGLDPRHHLYEAKSIIVLLDNYYRSAFPASLLGHFGRCYLDDDRITRDGLAQKVKAFRNFLREKGINSKVPFDIPHRLSAARAGLGTFGKNCMFYASRTARQSSWVLPIAIIVDYEFEADEASINIDCPPWCKNACIAACPTGALSGRGTINPQKCISYLTYYGDEITPEKLREPMGRWVYGCDRCQNVCPRNEAWLAQELPLNESVLAKKDAFELRSLLHMDREYYSTKIWPHMFYMPLEKMWKWKMNVARAMGNTKDITYISDLQKAFNEHEDERVRAMIIWAINKLGGDSAVEILQNLEIKSELEKVEYENALTLNHK